MAKDSIRRNTGAIGILVAAASGMFAPILPMKGSRVYASLLSHRAAVQPKVPALLVDKTLLNYQQFNEMVDRTARALDPLILGGRATVAVSAGTIRQWLLFLALARLGHVSVSMPPRPDLLQLAGVHAAIIGATDPEPEQVPSLRLDDAWWTRTLAEPCEPMAERAHWDDPARLMLSSGTTGQPKAVLLTHRMLQKRVTYEIVSQASGPFVGPAARICVSFPPSTIGGFVGPLLGWTLGGTVLFVDTTDFELLRTLRATSMVISTARLADALDRLPADFEPIPRLTITVGGSLVTQALASAAKARIAPRVIIAYGSTEGGVLCSADAGSLRTEEFEVGIRYPWLDAEIVDADGQVLPPGETGELRLRGEAVATRYENDPEASAKTFRDGWFYPGDIGALLPNGRVRIVGRAGEVLTGGDGKIAPEVLEEYFRAAPFVADAAAVTASDPRGLNTLYLALVVRGKVTEGEVRRYSEEAPIRAFRAIFLPSIPRSETGKVLREELRGLITAVNAQPPTPTRN